MELYAIVSAVRLKSPLRAGTWSQTAAMVTTLPIKLVILASLQQILLYTIQYYLTFIFRQIEHLFLSIYALSSEFFLCIVDKEYRKKLVDLIL